MGCTPSRSVRVAPLKGVDAHATSAPAASRDKPLAAAPERTASDPTAKISALPQLAVEEGSNPSSPGSSWSSQRFTAALWSHLAQDVVSGLASVATPADFQRHLHAFLRSEHNQTNLEFIIALERLASLPGSGLYDDREAMVQAVLDRYVRHDGVHAVNLSAHVRQLAMAACDHGFEVARAEVLQLVTLDCFPRFLRSRYCADLEAALRSAPDARWEYQSLHPGATSPHGSLSPARGPRTASRTHSAGFGSPPHDPVPSSPTPVSMSVSLPARCRTTSITAADVLAALRLAYQRLDSCTGMWLQVFASVANVLPGLSVVVVDMRASGCPVLFCNDSFCRSTGYTRDEVLGRNMRFVQGEDTSPETIAAMRKAIQTASEASFEVVNYRRTGEAFWARIIIKPVFDAGHPVHGAMSGAASGRVHATLRYFIGVSQEFTPGVDDPASIKRQQAIVDLLPSSVCT